jgi:hypothetical protein
MRPALKSSIIGIAAEAPLKQHVVVVTGAKDPAILGIAAEAPLKLEARGKLVRLSRPILGIAAEAPLKQYAVQSVSPMTPGDTDPRHRCRGPVEAARWHVRGGDLRSSASLPRPR